MRQSMDRREFLRSSGGLILGAAAGGIGTGRIASAARVRPGTPNLDKLGWKLSVALYSYRRYPFLEAIDKIEALGVRHLELCFFLRYDKARPKLKTNEDLPADVRKELKAKVAERGMALSSFYARLTADEKAARRTFAFCKEMGIGVIVSEPPVAAVEMIDGLCNEYGIRLAIHNHPAKDKNYTYWRPEGILAACQGRSKMVGACPDTGHWVRSGLDPVACLKKLKGRITSLHLKDAAEMGNPKAKDTILGRGKADYRAVLEQLKCQGFKGIMAIEYEENTPHVHDDMVKNVAFVKSVAKELVG